MHLWYRSTNYFDTPHKKFGCSRSYVYTTGLFVLVMRTNFTVLQVSVRYDLCTLITDDPDCRPFCWPYTAVFSLTKSSTLWLCSSIGDDWPDRPLRMFFTLQSVLPAQTHFVDSWSIPHTAQTPGDVFPPAWLHLSTEPDQRLAVPGSCKRRIGLTYLLPATRLNDGNLYATRLINVPTLLFTA